MKKILFSALLGINFSANAAYSNLIVFGDSQSDIGNMPESSNIGTIAPAYYDGLPYNLYIPNSNPVYGDQNNADDSLFQQLFNVTYLPAQPLINDKVRAGRSVNWSQYLFVTLKAQEQITSSVFVPWISLYAYPQLSAQNVSVNYAFTSALSTDNCTTQGYTPISAAFCNGPTIFNTQAIYRQHPNDNDLRQALVIPGVQKQIELFAEDLNAHRITADAHTLYIIWTGANDLTKTFLALIEDKDFFTFNHKLTQDIPALIAGQDPSSAVSRLYALGARHIVIIAQHNLGLAPQASRLTHTDGTFIGRYLNAYLLNLFILRYNLALSEQVDALQKRYPDLILTEVNLQRLFNRLSFLPGKPFFKHLGQPCQSKDAATYDAILRGDLVICTDYLYWNRGHMTYQGNRLVAEAILRALPKNQN
jgi:phospholipase/lecithinase/hemolysin